MEMRRDEFIAQFSISFHVHCLRMWRTRRNDPPTYITTCLHEWIGISRGRMALTGAEFSALTRPVIEALHRRLPRDERPTAEMLAGQIYDVLAAAGVDITLRPRTDAPSNARSMPPPHTQGDP